MNCIKTFSLVLITGLVAVSASAQTNTRVVDGKTYIVHKVVSGETLYKLSKKYSVTVQQIKDANGGSEQINIGQDVLIPGPEVGKTSGTGTNKVATTGSSTHVVKSGETLSKIAVKYGTSVDALKKLNGMSSADIKVGQKLKVPVAAESVETEVAEVTETEVKVVKAEVKKPEGDKDDKKPSNPRNPVSKDAKEDTGGQLSKGPRGGMPETADVVLAETATEKEELTTVKIVETGWDQTRTFVSHPTLPKGSIIVVINEATGKMAYCRVVENPKTSDLNGATMGMTKAVAEKIGMKESSGTVRIKYAAP